MNTEVRAKILNLSGMILRGKATKEDIAEVTKLAVDSGETELLKNELITIGKTLQACKRTE